MKKRLVFLAFVGILYGGIIVAQGNLLLEPVKDEPHFWQTALRFSEQWLPGRELLRDYGELSTPLPFVVFGWLERATGQGLFAGRLLNMLLSFSIVATLTLTARGPDRRVLLCAAGLLSFPYYLGVSAHLYTDIIAASFVFGGVWLWSRERPCWAAICFALAIASRQSMVAFPLAVAVFEFARWRSSRSSGPAAWVAPSLAAATLAGWFFFFGGPAPPAETARQAVATAQTLALRPQHALYSLACVGAYFVIPEWLLLCRSFDWRRMSRATSTGALLAVAVALAILFAIFPPLNNPEGYGIETMGFMDKAARRLLGDHDALRMLAFSALALLAGLRFGRWSIASLFVWANVLTLLKAHIGWDKYILPLLVVLWFLAARSCAEESSAPEDRPADMASG